MRLPRKHRFSAWDGKQKLALDADEIMAALANDLIEYGDLRWAMRNLASRGMRIPQGGALQGLRDMLRQLRERKRAQLERFNLDGLFDALSERLDAILKQERERIDQWLARDSAQTSAPDENYSDIVFKQVAERNAAALNDLPSDFVGRVKTLEHYEFLDPDAQKAFLELLNELRSAIAATMFNDVESMVQNFSDADMARMKDMLQALNLMLSRHIGGEDVDFDGFMQKYGDMFGDPPPQNIEELLAQMQQQMAAAQALLNSLSAEQRAALQDLMQDRFGDPELNSELAKLAKELDFLNPGGDSYSFSGSEQLGLDQAMQVMREMQGLDELIAQIADAERGGELNRIDQDLLRDLLGDDSANDLEELRKLQQALEDAGYVRSNDDGSYELTPRGSRVIGQKALGEIYARLKRQNLGNHAVPEEGRFGERIEQTKPYEFGDPFHLHMPRTLRNAMSRSGAGLPIRLQPEDFEIYRSEQITSTATAMLVDLSWSMALRGSFQAAKKVALALHNLITSQYPKDSFYIIGFAAYAKELKAHDLPYLQWDEYVLGTNMQHALLLAERLLAKHPSGSKQVIMISDGEPTAHLEGGEAQFAYPPTPETIRATLRAVKSCTRKGIAINTFMLDASYYLKAFMDEIAKINGGRVFYTSPESLGEYILVDYVQNKKSQLGRRAG